MKVASRVVALPMAWALVGLSAYAIAAEQRPATVLAQTQSVDFTVKIATISAGRLVILGNTTKPSVDVAISGTKMHAKSDAKGVFRFDVNYRTPDCSVKLATKTGALSVLVSDCGPQ